MRFFRRHPGRQVLLDLHLEMETHLLFHLLLVSSPARQRKQPAPELQENVHKTIHRPRPHSTLSDTNGSRLAPRRAGIQQASSATMISTAAITMNVSGSVALTPNSKVFSNRVNANAPANPSKAPMSASFIPSPITRRSTSLLCAPIAIRTPISRVRCVTV